MLTWLSFFADPYDRKARLRPALVSALPMFVSLLLLVPEFGMLWGVVSGAMLFCGATTLLTHFGRDLGKALELRLFEVWDGKPSVAMLRHRDSRLSASDKRRYREFIDRRIPGLKLASPRKENQFPEQADDGYQGATSWLLAQTRDRSRFRLVFIENMNYGFRRNVLALKPLAVLFDAITIGAIVFANIGLWRESGIVTPSAEAIVCAALSAVHALIFLAVVRKSWVYAVADAFARQLLAATDSLPTDPAQRPPAA